jgi:hypothetical protein
MIKIKIVSTTLTFSTPEKYMNGFEFHEVLNFTNDITLVHSQVYFSLPELPHVNSQGNMDVPSSKNPVA